MIQQNWTQTWTTKRLSFVIRYGIASILMFALLGCTKREDSGAEQTSSQEGIANTPDAVRKRMPLDQNNIDRFSARLSERSKQIEAGSENEWTISLLSKDIVESFGFSYEKTTVYYVLKVAPTASPVAQQLRDIFGRPLLNPSGAFAQKLVSAKTRDFFELLNATPSHNPIHIKAVTYLAEKHGTNVIMANQVVDGLVELQTKKELSGELAELNYKDDLSAVWPRIQYNLSTLDLDFRSEPNTVGGYLEVRDLNGLRKTLASQTKVKALASEMENFID